MSTNLKEIYELCFRHEEAVLNSEKCGCFSCGKIFQSCEINDWIDEPEISSHGQEKTAVCPSCGIDSVVPQSDSYEIGGEFLRAMYQKYFSRKTQ